MRAHWNTSQQHTVEIEWPHKAESFDYWKLCDFISDIVYRASIPGEDGKAANPIPEQTASAAARWLYSERTGNDYGVPLIAANGAPLARRLGRHIRQLDGGSRLASAIGQRLAEYVARQNPIVAMRYTFSGEWSWDKHDGYGDEGSCFWSGRMHSADKIALEESCEGFTVRFDSVHADGSEQPHGRCWGWFHGKSPVAMVWCNHYGKGNLHMLAEPFAKVAGLHATDNFRHYGELYLNGDYIALCTPDDAAKFNGDSYSRIAMTCPILPETCDGCGRAPDDCRCCQDCGNGPDDCTCCGECGGTDRDDCRCPDCYECRECRAGQRTHCQECGACQPDECENCGDRLCCNYRDDDDEDLCENCGEEAREAAERERLLDAWLDWQRVWIAAAQAARMRLVTGFLTILQSN